MTEMKQTPLFQLHMELGAKMTAFAGYTMPINYNQGIIHEHLHCRTQAGFFDISHMGQCRIVGRNAADELEKLTLGGISDLAIGCQKYTVLTNSGGGVIDDIIVSRTESGASVIVNASCKDKDFAYLKQQLPDSCRFEECTNLALLALQGPEASIVMASLSEQAVGLSFMQVCTTAIQGIPCQISRSGYTGEDGFEISVHQSKAELLARILLTDERVEPIGLGARDTLRLEAGLCLYGHELTETINPIEAGLGWLIKKGHLNFPGAERILAQRPQGLKRQRIGLLVEGKIPVRAGCLLYDTNGIQVGYITSGGFSPCLNRPLAMALIDSELSIVGQILYAIVRDQQIVVSVCHLPFIPHRYLR